MSELLHICTHDQICIQQNLSAEKLVYFLFHSTNTYATFIYIQDGDTPLHLACQFGHTDIVEQLLKAGADPHAVTKVSCMVCTELVYSSDVYPERVGKGGSTNIGSCSLTGGRERKDWVGLGMRGIGGAGQGAAFGPLGGPQCNSAFAIVTLRTAPVDEVGVPVEELGCLHEGIGWCISLDLQLHENVSRPYPSCDWRVMDEDTSPT